MCGCESITQFSQMDGWVTSGGGGMKKTRDPLRDSCDE